MENILGLAIESVNKSEVSYCKFLSANDTKATGGHQSGYLLGKSSWPLFLSHEPKDKDILKKDIVIKWQNDFETNSVFTFYPSKNELRLTRFQRKFPYRDEEYVGDLFVLSRKGANFFEAFILSHDDEIEDFFSAFNLSSTETNTIITKEPSYNSEDTLISCFRSYIDLVRIEFPTTFDLANNARLCYNKAYKVNNEEIIDNLDKILLNWIKAEFDLFKLFENHRYASILETPFKTVEEFIQKANSILNRRKSRAGSSLEHHLAEIFNVLELPFTTQKPTEVKKKPDFIFPSIEAYSDPHFDQNKLIFLASKTTCKDRWRQILNEADRIKTKHLFTLQQGISRNQLNEMYHHNVCLVVPEPYLKEFPTEFRHKILTLKNFTTAIKNKNYF